MGVGMILIIIYHLNSYSNYIDFTHPLFVKIIHQISHGSVDIFFFLSGFGLYYASLKGESKKQYYLRRFIRIYPVYIFALLAVNLLQNGSVTAFFTEFFALDLWMGETSPFWYISSIIILYIVFPFYINIFKQNPYRSTLAMIILGFILATLSVKFGVGNWLLILFLARIPIFFIGVLFGKLSLDKELDTSKIKIVLYAMMIVGFVILYTVQNNFYFNRLLWKGLLWYPLILITPGLCLLIASLFEKYKAKIIQRALVFLGAISFELYLVHSITFNYLDYYCDKFNLNIWIITSLVLLFSICIAYALHKAANKIASTVNSRISR